MQFTIILMITKETVGHGAGKHGVKYYLSLASLKSLYLLQAFCWLPRLQLIQSDRWNSEVSYYSSLLMSFNTIQDVKKAILLIKYTYF